MRTFEVVGDYGHLIVEMEHGLIVHRDRLDEQGFELMSDDPLAGRCLYDAIVKIDLSAINRWLERRLECGVCDPPLEGARIDIIDVAYWCRDGFYEPAIDQLT